MKLFNEYNEDIEKLKSLYEDKSNLIIKNKSAIKVLNKKEIVNFGLFHVTDWSSLVSSTTKYYISYSWRYLNGELSPWFNSEGNESIQTLHHCGMITTEFYNFDFNWLPNLMIKSITGGSANSTFVNAEGFFSRLTINKTAINTLEDSMFPESPTYVNEISALARTPVLTPVKSVFNDSENDITMVDNFRDFFPIQTSNFFFQGHEDYTKLTIKSLITISEPIVCSVPSSEVIKSHSTFNHLIKNTNNITKFKVVFNLSNCYNIQ